MNLRANRIGAILAFLMLRHRHDTTRVDDIVRNVQLLRHALVVCACDETRVIVRNDGGCIRGKFVEYIVWVGTASSKVKTITNANLLQPFGRFRYTLKNER